jgi:predicted nucleotidyltransferase
VNLTERRKYTQAELPAMLQTVIDTIRSVYEPEHVILYGSAGRGEDWHDIDLLVIVETEDVQDRTRGTA